MKHMKLLLLALLLPCMAFASEVPAFSGLTGLDQVNADAIVRVMYSAGTGEGGDAFSTADRADIAEIRAALSAIELGDKTDMSVTDRYPLLTMQLADCTSVIIAFNGHWLEHEGSHYELKNDSAFWKVLARLTKKYERAVEDVYIPGSLGSLYGELKTPGGSAVPLVILSHGFGGSHTGNRDYADFFLAHGFATFNLDFCGGGFTSRSDGVMQEMSVLTEAQDLNAVIDYFKADPRFTSILLWGASQGGFVSSYVAAGRPEDIAALVIEFPAYVLQDDARRRAAADGSFPATSQVLGATIGRRYNEDAVSFDIYEVIAGYTGPVLILHGDRDRIVCSITNNRTNRNGGIE